MPLLPDLTTRRREPEWMDAVDADPAELARSLAFIRRINVALGYTRATLGHLRRLVGATPPEGRLTVVDVATGSADVPAAVLTWAAAVGRDVRVIGLDLHADTLKVAAAAVPDRRFAAVRGDATRLPFADASVDYVLTGMFLHHLDEPAVVAVLREMGRVARRGVVVADLLRGRRAYAWVTLFTAAANPMVRHDARASVAGAFTAPELIALRDRAGLTYARPHRHFGHRLVLAGHKPPAGQTA